MTSPCAPPRCRPGDLAVLVVADYNINLGRIVRVIAPHDGTGDLRFYGVGHVWLVECAQPMTWTVGKKRYRRKCGPAPDCRLQSIRGESIGEQDAKGEQLKAPRAKEVEHV